MIRSIRTLLCALALAAPLVPTAASADVAPCGRCSSVGARPSSSAMLGAGVVVVVGVGGALAMSRRRK